MLVRIGEIEILGYRNGILTNLDSVEENDSTAPIAIYDINGNIHISKLCKDFKKGNC